MILDQFGNVGAGIRTAFWNLILRPNLCSRRSQRATARFISLRKPSAPERWKRLHQFLSEVGVKALRTQLGQTLGIAQVSETAEQYEANIRRVFGGQGDLFKK